jgi:hypothetical protein
MAATRPHRGLIVNDPPVILGKGGGAPAKNVGHASDGSARPDIGFSGDGLRITMRFERGVTRGDVLAVPFRFQVPVINDFVRSYVFTWATYDTLRSGQRSRPQGRQLQQLPIDTMLMDQPTADATSKVVVWRGATDPQDLIRELLGIAGMLPGREPQPFRLVVDQPAVWGSTPLINSLATLTALQATQKSGEVGTEYLSATFLEYDETQVGRNQQASGGQRPAQHGDTKYTLRAGDTLYSIATHSHFHQASAWKKIAGANGISGVSASSATELAAWAKRHHKTAITIPAK